MNRTTAARIAGFTFLFYIAVGISSMAGVFRGGPLQEVAIIAQNASAIVLALTLFIVTRDQGTVIAALGMIFRLAEGLLGAMLAMLGTTLSQPTLVSATLFAIGSTFFCWLLLRGKMMPGVLAWLGFIASVILIIGLPLQLAGVLRGSIAMLMWMPMLAFEVPGGLWLMMKAVPPIDGAPHRAASLAHTTA